MIYIVGIGIYCRESLSRRALSLIQGASLLVGSGRYLDEFSDFNGDTIRLGSDLDEVIHRIREGSWDGDVVILATGDPNLFGIAKRFIDEFGEDMIEIIPNVSTMQEAFARIKLSWEDAGFFSLHGRELRVDDIIKGIGFYKKIGIFTDRRNTPSRIAGALLDRGITGLKIYVCEEMGREEERVTEGRVDEIATKDFSPVNVMILVRDKDTDMPELDDRSASRQIFGIPDHLFSHREGVITKEEVRSVVLGKLRLRQDSILWDIGAGSGSVGIEAARIMGGGRVYAIEEDAHSISIIEKNVERFSVSNLVVVRGRAPEALKGLPEPDSVFIGGSGGVIDEILAYTVAHLKPEGRLVANFVTLENLSTALDILKKNGFSPEVVEIAVSRSEQVSDSLYLRALNPVFIFSVDK